jgi:hypothetical protein
MRRIISLFLLSVYVSFVAGALFSAHEDSDLIFHSSEFKGKYIASANDDHTYIVSQPANAQKIQKHSPFNGKIKLSRPGASSGFYDQTFSLKQSTSRLSRGAISRPAHNQVSIYLKNCIFLI